MSKRTMERLEQSEKRQNELVKILEDMVKKYDIENYYSAVCSEVFRGDSANQDESKRGRLFRKIAERVKIRDTHCTVKELIMDQIRNHKKMRKLGGVDQKNLMRAAEDLFLSKWKKIGETLIKRYQ